MSGGPFWYRFKAISCADPGEFQREMTRLSQDGWSLVECGLEEYKHWAHLRMEDRYKRRAVEDRRGDISDRRSYPAKTVSARANLDEDIPHARKTREDQKPVRRIGTRRLDRATGKEDQARIAEHEKRVGDLAKMARGPNTGG